MRSPSRPSTPGRPSRSLEPSRCRVANRSASTRAVRAAFSFARRVSSAAIHATSVSYSVTALFAASHAASRLDSSVPNPARVFSACRYWSAASRAR